MRKTHY